ncbi:glycosyl hydrolase [Phytohabitans sp. ZYX-F-186]|uniref:Glycosyl hydrolase n=1 Tax=Phytohabitans maris TaxID=3071409 RepID=A0ABU0ZSV3_9ACTN|nr:glycosyl hydrolase [Phytohabitans sp. ZYX-F-186]MDQ7910099.1 glycosyl hydrolase [Phytohabitans sp. ZYX-F-186]
MASVPRALRRVFLVLTALAVTLLSSAVAARPALADQAPSNPNTAPYAADLLDWLSELPRRMHTKVVSGQFVSPNYGRPEYGMPTVQDAWDYHVEELHDLTGEYVGLVGFDPSNRTYQGGTAAENMPDFTNFRQLAKDYSDQGGIVHLTWHAANPFSGAHAWSTIPSGHTLAEIATTGTAANTQWMTWLDAIADGLQWFEDNQVPVIWRPFHELNGGWFWWGGGSNPDFVTVWRHMYDYLTATRGLDNLLWAWSPDVGQAFGTKVTARYPGNGYVDIVAFDRYGASYTNRTYYDHFRSATYGKVLGFSEVGLATGTGGNSTVVLNEIKTHFPDMAFFMFWMRMSTNFSIRGNPGAADLMNDPWTLNLDEIGVSVPLPTIVDDASAAFTYGGTWTHSADPLYHAGTKSVSNTAGAWAEATFTGTSLRVHARKLPSGGKFDVYVDGAFVASADTYAVADYSQAGVFQRGGLAAGSHTVRLVLNGSNPASSGAWVGLDYLAYQ